MKILMALMCMSLLYACKAKPDYYLKITDSTLDKYGYVNLKGDTVIPLGKYLVCYSDTFTNYAIVLKKNSGWVAINKEEKTLFDVYLFDNGPDYPSDRLFRITKNGKIGYADLKGNIVIKPQFDCAFPFEKGLAKVSVNCKSVPVDADGEHHQWVSDQWFYVNKAGIKVQGK